MGAGGYGEELECHQRNPETLKGKKQSMQKLTVTTIATEAQSMYRNQAHLFVVTKI